MCFPSLTLHFRFTTAVAMTVTVKWCLEYRGSCVIRPFFSHLRSHPIREQVAIPALFCDSPGHFCPFFYFYPSLARRTELGFASELRWQSFPEHNLVLCYVYCALSITTCVSLSPALLASVTEKLCSEAGMTVATWKSLSLCRWCLGT
jgi:hypothetical protein